MLTTVATYSFPYEAQIARAKLDSEGIPAFVADEQTINMQWLYSNALGGVRLQVPKQFAQQASEILAEDYSEDLVQEKGIDTDHCQACNSANTEPYQKGRRWAFLVFLGLDFPLFPVKNTVRCRACGHISNPSSR
jgi:Putative prokaryotic signal transducing protein